MKLQIAGLCSLSLVLAACGETPAEETGTAPETETATEEVSLADAISAADGPYAPKNDCGELYGFDSFRGQLRRAVTFQSESGLIALSDPNIKLDFGGGAGTEELSKRLEADPALWGEMADALALGCSAQGDAAVTMPWIFANLPDDADGFSTYLVTANEAPIHETADATSASTTTVSWDLVKLAGDAPAEDAEFVEVSTMDDSATGFMAADQLRMVNGYRILANRGDDGWKITAFVTGD